MYVLEYEDWADAKSVIRIIVVFYAKIGELYRVGHSHRDLVQASLFYNACDYPHRSSQEQYGRLEEIKLPSFGDPA